MLEPRQKLLLLRRLLCKLLLHLLKHSLHHLPHLVHVGGHCSNEQRAQDPAEEREIELLLQGAPKRPSPDHSGDSPSRRGRDSPEV